MVHKFCCKQLKEAEKNGFIAMDTYSEFYLIKVYYCTSEADWKTDYQQFLYCPFCKELL